MLAYYTEREAAFTFSNLCRYSLYFFKQLYNNRRKFLKCFFDLPDFLSRERTSNARFPAVSDNPVMVQEDEERDVALSITSVSDLKGPRDEQKLSNKMVVTS